MTNLRLALNLFLALNIFAASTTAAFREPSQDTEKTKKSASADEIIDSYVRALGGEAAILRIKSRLARGAIEVPAAGMAGTAEFWTEAPNRYLSIAAVSGSVISRTCFDGKAGWAQDIPMGLRDLAGRDLSQLKRQAEFYASLHLRQLYPKMEVTGTDKVNDRPVHIIEATPIDDPAEKLYFDDETGLLVRRDSLNASPTGPQPTQWYYEDYREVDGVKVAFTWRAVTPLATVVVKFNEVKNNAPVSDTLFQKPKI
jgi:hypothetical protein